MRWNLKKPRTGPNLSYHFPWSSQMLAVLLWIAKPVWQCCLPFSKLFFKKSAKKPLFLCTFLTTKKLVKSQKGCSWPLKKGRLIFKVHTQDFLVVSFNRKQFKLNLGGEISCNTYCYFALLKEKRGCPSLQVSKKVYIFLELFCLVCIVAWGQDSLSKKK